MARLQHLRGDTLSIPINQGNVCVEVHHVQRPDEEPYTLEWWVELEISEEGCEIKDKGLHREEELENCTRLEF